MPATESTWRDMPTMHRVFAVSGVVLTIATIWMFYKDHNRPWKDYQSKQNEVEQTVNQLRQRQLDTNQRRSEVALRSTALRDAALASIPAAALDEFSAAIKAAQAKKIGSEQVSIPVGDAPDQSAAVQKLNTQLDKVAELRAAAAQAQGDAKKSAEAELSAAISTAQATRTEIVSALQRVVLQAKIEEDKELGVRKFKNADLDAARANLDLAVRDNLPQATRDRLQEKVNQVTAQVDLLTLKYQALSEHRKTIEKIVKSLTDPVDAAKKALDASTADLARLEAQFNDRRETLFNDPLKFNGIPFLGKKWLNFVILDAFMSRRKVENLWSTGLLENYSHAMVRRFDRCTTCHQGMQKSAPGEPTTPAYPHESRVELAITPRTAEEIAAQRAQYQSASVDGQGQPLPPSLEELIGLSLRDQGLLDPADVVVEFVAQGSPAAAAPVKTGDSAPRPGTEIRHDVITGDLAAKPVPKPGVLLGDAIVEINGSPLLGQYRGAKVAQASLYDAAASGKPFTITVKRGLPHPYASHPRLDLFVSDASPHKMGEFACTICHEGQGSATDFRWASHTPDTVEKLNRWTKDYGWFDNHHWIYPMNSARFAESSCLKCHHNVVELEASERFPQTPAPKLTHGYHLIRKYGCYGCHEVNGYDGPNKRVGPDLRIEPNYFAAAQQLLHELSQTKAQVAPAAQGGAEADAAKAALWERWTQMASLAEEVAAHPDRSAPRAKLRQLLTEDQTAGPAGAVAPPSAYGLMSSLNDVEIPGTLRKPGPSLRFAQHKLSPEFLYDWMVNPQHFRPSTRMPKFFGQWKHLEAEPEQKAKAERLEPIEIMGMLAYLYDNTQGFTPLPRTKTDGTPEEKIARGQRQFETRGCLACHTHGDFPAAAKFRQPGEIVQGPDLTGLGGKFNGESGLDWLYSWIKEPTRYHARTVMPNLYLTPETYAVDKVSDPAEDIALYLLSSKTEGYAPVKARDAFGKPLEKAQADALKELTLEYLNDAFYKEAAARYYDNGIPESLRGELKGAEADLVVGANEKPSDAQRLRYIGRKTISKYGCFGCHDIPGFEDAKPIGAQLQDWGRKDPSRLAFEHITHYAGHHGHGGHGADHAHEGEHGEDHAHDAKPAKKSVAELAAEHKEQETADFYTHHLEAGNRIGFAYQKLKEPRSYDYLKTQNKRYNERLRMPQFPFTAEEREAVLSFVLGLVAEPPTEKYLYKPNPRMQAVLAGKQVLEKFNCGACHMLEAETWKIAYTPGAFVPEGETKPLKADVYPFLYAHATPDEVAASKKTDFAGRRLATLHGLPVLTDADGLPAVIDAEFGETASEEPLQLSNALLQFGLTKPVLLDGQQYWNGLDRLTISGTQVVETLRGRSGMLARYLLPRVTAIERETNPNAKGGEAYGWVPPPLIGEGEKVQSGWLYEFLLEPYPIRPASFLRMPKFNLSADDATKLVNYFGAIDHANYPYDFAAVRQEGVLQERAAAYQKKVGEAHKSSRFEDAMKLVTDKNACVKCHQVADFMVQGAARGRAPNLADVYRRLRPEYLRKWVANPAMTLPYTAMPAIIAYDPAKPHHGGLPQELYSGSSTEQLDAVVDLLMNYDQYSRSRAPIKPLVAVDPPKTEGAAPEAAPAPPEAKPAAEAPKPTTAGQ